MQGALASVEGVESVDVDFKNMMWKQLSALVVVNLQAVGVFAVFFVGVYQISDGLITLGTLLAFAAVAGRITPSVTTLIGFLVGVQDALVNIERGGSGWDLHGYIVDEASLPTVEPYRP